MSARGVRTWVSGGLLLLGSAAFWISLALPAVRADTGWGKRPRDVGGWTAAVNHEPTYGTNAALALAFVLWAGAAWFRSIWCWYGGAIAMATASVLHAFVGFWPGYHGITLRYSGYWTWLAAGGVILASILVLPRPARPAPGERLPRPVVRAARTRLAAVFACAGTVLVIVSHSALPIPVATTYRELAPGEAQPESSWYTSGPTRSSSSREFPVTEADGSVRKVREVAFTTWGPLLPVRLARAGTFAISWAMLLWPLLFLAAATTARPPWRLAGAAAASVIAVALPLWDQAPWPTSSTGPHPVDVLWYGTPYVWLVAFALLPGPRIDSSA